MKKLLLSFVLSMIVCLLFAQRTETTVGPRFSFGVSLEAGYSGEKDFHEEEYFDGSEILELRRGPGYSAGLWMVYHISPRWDFELGGNLGAWRAYAQKESNYYGPGEMLVRTAQQRYVLQQELLRIPLQTRFYFGQPEHLFQPFITVGLQAVHISKQTNDAHYYSGAIGQPSTESFYSIPVNLDGYWVDVERWQSSVIGGIGVRMDRASLSIQRNRPFSGASAEHSKISGYYPDICSDHPEGVFITTCNYDVRQLMQTSLRFTYRIF